MPPKETVFYSIGRAYSLAKLVFFGSGCMVECGVVVECVGVEGVVV